MVGLLEELLGPAPALPVLMMVLVVQTVLPAKRDTLGTLLGVSLTVSQPLFLRTMGLFKKMETSTALMEGQLEELLDLAHALPAMKALAVQTVLHVQRATVEMLLSVSLIVTPLQYQQMTDHLRNLETSTA